MITELKRNIKNIIGKRTKRKLVAFFVDDYGSIRTKNKVALKHFINEGIEFPKNTFSFSRYDTLANEYDLLALFEVLKSVKDKKGSYGCFTPFTIVANPDFEKIRESNYSQYYRESFKETLKQYDASYKNVFSLWMEGIRENIFHPVYHGTEHLNVKRFMEALNNNHRSTHLAFDNNSICIPSFKNENPILNPTANFDIDSMDDIEQLKQDVAIGLEMFQELFGYQSKLFTPGAAKYHPALHGILKENSIKYINVNRSQQIPLGNNQYKSKLFYNGQKTKEGQFFIVRNAVFEPHGRSDYLVADNCLKDIESAFRWNSPAVISSHRINFIGHFSEEWRDNSLKQLKYLLHQIKTRWPEVEFVNGEELCDILFNQNY